MNFDSSSSISGCNEMVRRTAHNETDLSAVMKKKILILRLTVKSHLAID